MNEKFFSCLDIQGSVYLAPNEIRACCKRFFVNGNKKGDVKLRDHGTGKKIQFIDIIASRQELIERINSNQESECSGCPYLAKRNWSKPTAIKHISIEHHSICNLRCTYCSDTYYGGDYAKYDLIAFLNSIISENKVAELESIVWGGGEPFLDVKKDQIFEFLDKVTNISDKIDIRIFSNSIRYETKCQHFLDLGKIFLTTSIDAGTSDTYMEVRGKSKLLQVFENLARYAAVNPNRITVKYIFTRENSSIREIESFMNLVLKNNLANCNFQISIDFNLPRINLENFMAIIRLAWLFQENRVSNYFLDDLIYLRLREFYRENQATLKEKISTETGWSMVAPLNLAKPVTIWGAGFIGEQILGTSLFAKFNRIINFVDRNFVELNKSSQSGLPILNPSTLQTNENYVVIASSQNFQEILLDFDQLGLDRSRLIRGIIL